MKKIKVPKVVINKGRGPQPEQERNQNLINDYQAGMNTVDLVSKYKISWQRINTILNKYGVPRTKQMGGGE